MITVSSAEEFHAAVAAATETPLVACFSASWSGGCKLVAPKVEKLAEGLDGTASFARVSAEELETLCEEVEVDNFPHFRVYKGGKILGDCSSSKFDKVDAFIRGLVAPETVKQTEETPEGDTATEEAEKESDERGNESTGATGTKKREEREEMNDEQVTKKAKTEVNASADADDKEREDEEDDETAESASEEAEAAFEKQVTTAEVDAAPAMKIEKEGDAPTVDAASA